MSVDWMDEHTEEDFRAAVLGDLRDGDAPRVRRVGDISGYRDRDSQGGGRRRTKIPGECSEGGGEALTPERSKPRSARRSAG